MWQTAGCPTNGKLQPNAYFLSETCLTNLTTSVAFPLLHLPHPGYSALATPCLIVWYPWVGITQKHCRRTPHQASLPYLRVSTGCRLEDGMARALGDAGVCSGGVLADFNISLCVCSIWMAQFGADYRTIEQSLWLCLPLTAPAHSESMCFGHGVPGISNAISSPSSMLGRPWLLKLDHNLWQ